MSRIPALSHQQLACLVLREIGEPAYLGRDIIGEAGQQGFGVGSGRTGRLIHEVLSGPAWPAHRSHTIGFPAELRFGGSPSRDTSGREAAPVAKVQLLS